MCICTVKSYCWWLWQELSTSNVFLLTNSMKQELLLFLFYRWEIWVDTGSQLSEAAQRGPRQLTIHPASTSALNLDSKPSLWAARLVFCSQPLSAFAYLLLYLWLLFSSQYAFSTTHLPNPVPKSCQHEQNGQSLGSQHQGLGSLIPSNSASKNYISDHDVFTKSHISSGLE